VVGRGADPGSATRCCMHPLRFLPGAAPSLSDLAPRWFKGSAIRRRDRVVKVAVRCHSKAVDLGRKNAVESRSFNFQATRRAFLAGSPMFYLLEPDSCQPSVS
jgi:hypothetical protein